MILKSKRFSPKGNTHAKPFNMVINALYQNDVQFGDKIIPFKMVKCITRQFQGHIELSYHLFCPVLNYCEAFKQNNICSNGSF